MMRRSISLAVFVRDANNPPHLRAESIQPPANICAGDTWELSDDLGLYIRIVADDGPFVPYRVSLGLMLYDTIEPWLVGLRVWAADRLTVLYMRRAKRRFMRRLRRSGHGLSW